MDPSELRDRVDDLFPELHTDLERLIGLPSVAFEGFRQGPLQETADAVAALIAAAGMPQVELLELPGAPPVVYAAHPAAPGAPTVLLYAHYDVQPAGDEAKWTSPPFQPTERGGRLYGRGACDDKSGIVMHTGALRAIGGDCAVGIKIVIEGQEETGFGALEEFVLAHPGLFTADAIVIADAGNRSLGVPTLTTSLRGLVAVDLEVATLEGPVHSGSFGGVAPDALIALARIIATMHDADGDVAIEGLDRIRYDGAEYDEDAYRAHSGVLPDVALVGSGGLAERLFARPSVNVIGIDAPVVREATNSLVPRARARVSVRLAPGQDPAEAQRAVARHLLSVAPWNVRVTITPSGIGDGYLAETGGPVHAAAAEALRVAFGRDVVHFGQGGSIPLVAAFHQAVPGAEIVLWGAGEPQCRVHAPDESVDLAELQRCVLAEALLLAHLSG